MEVNRTRVRDGRSLTADAFERLLGVLDDDRDRAGDKYERVRHKLASLFRWRGCANPDELVDRTIDRVARRLASGAELRVADPYLYFHGVALNVLREHWRDEARAPLDIEALGSHRLPSTDPTCDEKIEFDRVETERRVTCLTRCLETLGNAERRLIRAYHMSGEGTRVDARKTLARDLGVQVNALRIRAYRIRVGLQECVERCLRA